MKHFSTSIALLSGILFTSLVQASGFQLQEQSVTAQGRGIAGGSLAADDASAAFYNPADMLLLTDNRLQLGAIYIHVKDDFKNNNSSNTLSQPIGSNDDGGTNNIVPNLYAIGGASSDWRYSFAITSTFGSSTKYDDAWTGRYHALNSNLKTIDYNVGLAHALTNNINIGAGVSYQYIDATLTNSFFNGVQDVEAKMTGNDYSPGYNLGLTWHNEDLRLSATYRSQVSHTLEGNLTIPTILPSANVAASADVVLPETVTLNSWYRINQHWEVMATAFWTNWERLDELRIKTGVLPDDVTRFEWKSTLGASIGTAYTLSPEWKLRSGLGYDPTPIKNKNFRAPRVPDSDRYWLAVGASWQLSPDMQMDVAYTHIFFNQAAINSTVPIAGGPNSDTLNGTFNSTVDMLGLQVSYLF